MRSLSRPPPSRCAHCTSTACAACLACQLVLPTTAKPAVDPATASRLTIFSIPAMASAALVSIDLTLPPNMGAMRMLANSMPGWRTSMPKRAVPLVFPGMSPRIAGWPIRVQSLRSFSTTLAGVVPAAALANSPKWPDLPEAWLTTPALTVNSAVGTFHCWAAACSKLARAVAAASRSGTHASDMLEEPPVTLTPSSRATLPTTHSPVRTNVDLLPSSEPSG